MKVATAAALLPSVAAAVRAVAARQQAGAGCRRNAAAQAVRARRPAAVSTKWTTTFRFKGSRRPGGVDVTPAAGVALYRSINEKARNCEVAGLFVWAPDMRHRVRSVRPVKDSPQARGSFTGGIFATPFHADALACAALVAAQTVANPPRSVIAYRNRLCVPGQEKMSDEIHGTGPLLRRPKPSERIDRCMRLGFVSLKSLRIE